MGDGTLAKLKLDKITWFLFVILLGLDVVSLLLDKIASNNASVAGDGLDFYKSLIVQIALWTSLGLAPLQLITWTKILSKVELGVAYAISSLHIPATMLAAIVVLNENLPWHVYLAGAIITAGVIILGSESKE